MGLGDDIVERCNEAGGWIGGEAADTSGYSISVSTSVSNSVSDTVSNVKDTAKEKSEEAKKSVDNTTSETNRSSWLIPDWITDTVHKSITFFKNFPNNIWTALKDKVYNKIVTTVGEIVRTSQWLKNKIVGWIEDTVKKVVEAGGWLKEKIESLAKSTIEKAVEAGGWLKDKIIGFINDTVTKAIETGGWLRDTIIGWIEDRVKTIHDIWIGLEPKVKALIPTAIELLGAAPEALYSLFPAEPFWDWFTGIIESMLGEVQIEEK